MSASISSDAGREGGGPGDVRPRAQAREKEDLRQRLLAFAAAVGLDESATLQSAEAGLKAAGSPDDSREGRVSAFSQIVRDLVAQERGQRLAPGAPAARLVLTNASAPQTRASAPERAADRPALALGSLTPCERAALLLVVVEGFRHQEAASALRLAPDAFGALLAHGRARLAARMSAVKLANRPALRIVR